MQIPGKHARLLTAAALVLVAGCGLGDDQPDSASEPSARDGSTVLVTNNEFTPATIEIGTGESVTWQWEQGTHNVVFDDVESDVLSGGTWSRTFDTSGSYDYVCTLHSGMTGTVLVG